jgi:hypothetical protein
MRLNADFTQRVVIRPDDTPWQSSPSPGMTRRMLVRVGDGPARILGKTGHLDEDFLKRWVA